MTWISCSTTNQPQVTTYIIQFLAVSQYRRYMSSGASSISYIINEYLNEINELWGIPIYNCVCVDLITTALEYTKDAVGASVSLVWKRLSIECPPDQIKYLWCELVSAMEFNNFSHWIYAITDFSIREHQSLTTPEGLNKI